MDIQSKVIDDFGSNEELSQTIQTWTLQETLTRLAIVLSFYLVIHLKVLPGYMKKREPYKINKIMLAYNVVQVALSVYMVLIYLKYIYQHGVITKRCPKGNDLQEMDIQSKVIDDFGSNEELSQTIQTWTLQETLTRLAIVLSFYLVIHLKVLPGYMKKREPYKINKIMLAYNVVQVALSVYMVLIYLKYIYQHGVITKRCPKGNDLQEVINDIYPYFIAKHLDLLDTMFFVLRKKDNQVTFLHLYHHTTMVTWTWLHLLYYPTDNFVVVGMLNSFVHVLMYAYYGLTALGPRYQKYVWWKKHLTKVQLVQFILVVSHLHFQQKLSPCPIPSFFNNFCMFLICSFFALFMKFYINSYRKRKIPEKQKTESKNQRLLKVIN